MTVRPRAWALFAVVTVAGTVAAACGGTTSDDGAAAPVAPAAGAAASGEGPVETWDPADGPGDVTLRPVVTCEHGAELDESAGEELLPDVGGDERCVVGPPAGSGQVFERNSAAVSVTGPPEEWVVAVDVRAAGQVVVDALAERCSSGADGCESGRIAIVLDDVIQWAPSAEALEAAGTIRISGDLTEAHARLLARALNSGAAPIDSDDDASAASDTIAPRRPATTTTVARPTSVPATTAAPRPEFAFAMPEMCGLPAADWASNEHPDSQMAGTWAMGSRDEGDLDGDGRAEFACATMCGDGTVAAERSVHVFDSDRQPLATLPVAATTAALYPDRRVHALEPRIADDEIEVEVWVWQATDDECCPSVTFALSFAWDGTGFVATTDVPDPTAANDAPDESPVTDWDGIYRPATGRVVRLGEFGRQVELLQRELVERGYVVDVDGYFGDGTEAAVRRFQSDRGLPVTGVAGEAVWDEFDE